MADIGDIHPLYPILPLRPNDKSGPRKHPRQPAERDKQTPAPKPGEEGDPHIDEYA
ncbi:MAG TPA: hypothetical protein VJM76_04965 [Gammaproteobacteria bacterium]|nr:hypothetical protein [Gammaproteobacteria bacterium]